MATHSADAIAAAPEERRWIDRLWTSIADRGRPFAKVPGGPVPAGDRARLLAEALLSERGEASGAAVARELQAVLAEMDPDQLGGFFHFLAGAFLPEPGRLRAAATTYLSEPSASNAAALAAAAEPPRQELLRRMNLAPGGMASLLALRKAVLELLRAEPDLRPLDEDLRHLFTSWFNRGFLELRGIDWQTPAAVLEKLIAYEAVHEIKGWEDLRRRLAPDRRCFAFFHPALPNEPLIFVEVALVKGLAEAVQPLLTPPPPAIGHNPGQRPDTAIFYSISNCQDGLRGISFGNLLIKQVVEELRAEELGLTQFATLSPVPGFRRWLDVRLEALAAGGSALSKSDRTELSQPVGTTEGGASDLASLLAMPLWWENPALRAQARPALLRLCADYLTRGGPRQDFDPVARFHLGNGARLERINWMGNSAPRGLAESYGIMVNYLYDLDTIEGNHEAFARDRLVARSRSVDALLSPSPPAAGRSLRQRVGAS